MEFWQTILVLLRRRSVALPVLLLPLGLAAVTYFVIPTQYLSTATVVLTTSANGGVLTQDPTRPPPEINPLRNFDGMKTAASILIQVMNTSEVAKQLGVANGGAARFTVSDGSAIPQLLGSNGPFMVIEGYSTSPIGARNMVVRVEKRLRDELTNQQRVLRAPPATLIGIIDVVPPSAPEAQNGTKLKVAAAALVLGLIASMSVAYFAHQNREPADTEAPAPDGVAARPDEALATSPLRTSSEESEDADRLEELGQ